MDLRYEIIWKCDISYSFWKYNWWVCSNGMRTILLEIYFIELQLLRFAFFANHFRKKTQTSPKFVVCIVVHALIHFGRKYITFLMSKLSKVKADGNPLHRSTTFMSTTFSNSKRTIMYGTQKSSMRRLSA